MSTHLINPPPPTETSKPVSWGVKMREFCGRAWRVFADLPKSLSSLAERIGVFFHTIWNEYEETVFSNKNTASQSFSVTHIDTKLTPPSSPTPPASVEQPLISSVNPADLPVTSPQLPSSPASTLPVEQLPISSVSPTELTPPSSPYSSLGVTVLNNITSLATQIFPSSASSLSEPFTLINVKDDGSCYYYSVIAGIVRSNNEKFWDHFTNILRKTQENLPDNIKKILPQTVDFQKISFSAWVKQVGIPFDQDLSCHAGHLKPIVILLRHAIANFIEENLHKQDALGEELRARLDVAISDEPSFTDQLPKKPDNGSYIELDRTLRQVQELYPKIKENQDNLKKIIPKDDVVLPDALATKRKTASKFLSWNEPPPNLASWLGLSEEQLGKMVSSLPLFIERQKQEETAKEEERLKKMDSLRQEFLKKMKNSDQWANDLQTSVLPLLLKSETAPLLGVRIWGPNGILKSADLEPLGSAPQPNSIQIDMYHANGHYQVINSHQENFKNVLEDTQKKKEQQKQLKTTEFSNFENFYNKNINPLLKIKSSYSKEMTELLSHSTHPKIIASPVSKTTSPPSSSKPSSPSTAPASSTQKLTPAEELIQQIDTTIRSISSHREATAFLPSLKSMKEALSKNADTALEQYSAFTETLSTMAGIGIQTPEFPEIPALTPQKKQLPLGVIPTPSDGSCAIYALCLSALANQEAQELLSKETSFNNLIEDKENLQKNGVTDLSSQSMQNLSAVSKGLRKKLAENLQVIVDKKETDRSEKEKMQIMSMQSAAWETLSSDKDRREIIKTWRAKEDELTVLDNCLTKENRNKNEEEDLLSKTNQEKIEKTKEKTKLLERINSLKQKKNKTSKVHVKGVYQKAINKAEQQLEPVSKALKDIENNINTQQNSVNKTKSNIEDFEKRRAALLEDSSYKQAKKDFYDMCLKNGYPNPEHLETGYVQTIANHSSYLDHVAIEELSSLLKVRIQVFQRNSKTGQVDPVVTYNPDQEKWPVVSMFFEDRHYSAYIPPPPTSSLETAPSAPPIIPSSAS